MKRLYGSMSRRDVLLVFAAVVLIVQLFGFSSIGQHVVAQGPNFVQEVFVTNTDSDPVPVEVTNATNTVEIVHREAFQRSIHNIPGQADVDFVRFNVSVPDGKRLVIESASVHVTVPSGQSVTARISANGPPGNPVGTQHFVLSRQGSFGGNDVFTGNHSMLLWAGPGDNNVGITVKRSSSTGFLVVEAAIVGYLEDL